MLLTTSLWRTVAAQCRWRTTSLHWPLRTTTTREMHHKFGRRLMSPKSQIWGGIISTSVAAQPTSKTRQRDSPSAPQRLSSVLKAGQCWIRILRTTWEPATGEFLTSLRRLQVREIFAPDATRSQARRCQCHSVLPSHLDPIQHLSLHRWSTSVGSSQSSRPTFECFVNDLFLSDLQGNSLIRLNRQ